MQEKITAILTEMTDHLTPAQMKRLQEALVPLFPSTVKVWGEAISPLG